MEDTVLNYQRRLDELAWQDRVRLLAAHENRPIPRLPLPKESRFVVELMSRKDEEHGIFDPKQEDCVYFFCAYYTLPKDYEGGWIGRLKKGQPVFCLDEEVKPEPYFLHSVVRELASRFPCFGHKSVARYSQTRFCYFHILRKSAETTIGMPLVPPIPEEEIIERMQNWDGH